MGSKIPHPSTLRRSIKRFYDQKIGKIRNYFRNKDVFFIIDETTDSQDRNVVNVMVGALDGKKPKIALVNVKFANAVNDVIIRQIILETCKKIWRGDNIYPRLKLIISDQDSYMLSAVKKMKEGVVFPFINHITCVFHAVNLVCEIQEYYSLVNLLIKEMTKFFRNAPKRKKAFRDSTGFPLPPFPIIIRFGSWLNCVKYFLQPGKWEKIKTFFIDADPAELAGVSSHLATIKKILSGKKIESDLIEVSNYVILTDIMKRLEARD